MNNTFGRVFCLTTFGESHGSGVGGVVDGCPAGLKLEESIIQKELDARRPGPGGAGGSASTTRQEPDRIRILSGVFEGKTTGAPIAFFIENTSQRSGDYDKLRDIFRPGHADYAWQHKYGLRDYRGGGRASARETAARVAGGAIAQELLAGMDIRLRAYTVELGGIPAPLSDIEGSVGRPFFCPDADTVSKWEARVDQVREQGDSLGGIVQVEALNVPAGLGEPVFDGLDARLGAAFLSVGAVKGVEVGAGFAAARLLGSENNDVLVGKGFLSNNAGGVLGGVSSGANLLLRAAIKPIPSVAKRQTVMTSGGEAVELEIGGRHDISPIPRIVPVLKAMTALVLADFLLLQQRMNIIKL